MSFREEELVPRRRKTQAWMSDAAAQPALAAHISKKITSNQKRIIDALGEEPFAVYSFLSSECARGGVDKNPLFQFVYRSYYRLDNAGLTPDFKSQYFKLMENARITGNLDLPAIATNLHQYETQQDHNSLQFSFVTKLAATVDPTYPIYDSAVGTALGFPRLPGGKDFARRLEGCLQFYDWLGDLYRTFLASSALSAPIAALEAQYPLAATLPPIKALDFLFWSAGKLEIVLVPS
jgi:hypothetical protein